MITKHLVTKHLITKRLGLISALTLSASATAFAASVKVDVPLEPKSASTVAGTLHFEEVGDGVKITGEIKNLTPGNHGFHIHEKGDCSSADAASAGGHFNPENAAHGAPDAAAHHAGDFGNLVADEHGVAKVDMLEKGRTLQGANSLTGHAVVVHGGADDLTSQPAGNSGPRVACGVIPVVH